MRGKSALLAGFCVLGVAAGCGSFLSIGDDEDDSPAPAAVGSSETSTTTPPGGPTDGSLPEANEGELDGGLEPVEASLIDADGGPGCTPRLQRCIQNSECCGKLLGGQFKEVCRTSPRVCDRCAQTGEACNLRSECCGVTSVCTGGFCEN